MILTFVLGFILGVLSIPLYFIFRPHKKKPIVQRNNVQICNSSLLKKSLKTCTDLHWLNVLISRFWFELSQAQVYRLKSYLSKCFETKGIVKRIEVDDVNIGKEAPQVESIRVVSWEEVEEMINKGKVDDYMSGSKDDGNDESGCKDDGKLGRDKDNMSRDEDNMSRDEDNMFIDYATCASDTFANISYCSNIFQNVHTLLKIKHKGEITLKLKIHTFNNFTFSINVYIGNVEGCVLVRFPSLDNNTKLEYTFISYPKIDITVEGCLSRNEGKKYFKELISNFVRRSIRFLIYKMLVYPSFSNLVLPLIGNLSKHCHFIKKINTNSDENDLKDLILVLSEILMMDYKTVETFKGITIKKSHQLINEKDKITSLNIPIPDKITIQNKSKHLYEGLTIKESKIMNLIYDLSIFREVFLSFRECKDVYNLQETRSYADFDTRSQHEDSYTKEYEQHKDSFINAHKTNLDTKSETQSYTSSNHSKFSLVEITLNNEKIIYVRIVHKNTIYFQRNDEDNPEFLIFQIVNKQLVIYQYITTKHLIFTKKRITRLLGLFSDKPQGKLISFYNLLKMPKEAYKYLKGGDKKITKNDKRPNTVNDLIPRDKQPLTNDDLKFLFTKYMNNPGLLELRKVLYFDYPLESMKEILTEEIRLRLLSENPKIYRVIKETNSYKCLAIENTEDDKDFIMYTAISDKGERVIDDKNDKNIGEKLGYTDEGDKQVIKDNTVINETDNMINVPITNTCTNTSIIMDIVNDKKTIFVLEDLRLSMLDNISSSSVHSFNKQTLMNVKRRTRLKIYGDAKYEKNYFLESIKTRLRQHEYLKSTSKHEFIEIKDQKIIKKEFIGGTGGVFIEIRTNEPDDFRLILTTTKRKVILDILKIITTRPFKMVLPLYEGIFTLRLYPKHRCNENIYLKIVNLPMKYANESLIDCEIGLRTGQKFIFPTIGSSEFIIFWEKDTNDILGTVEKGETTVEISGNGNIRTDDGEYSIIYKNIGKKKRDIKIYMGCTKVSKMNVGNYMNVD